VNFPSFGDAAVYDQLGRACADALRGRGGTVFDACYHPIRPRGIALVMALPHLVTSDPVAADYVMLALNVLFFALALAALAAGLEAEPSLWPGRERRLLLASFAVLLPNLVSHLPVRLGDLPSLAVFLVGVALGMRTAASRLEARPLAVRYAVMGLLCAAAVLLKVTYFVYGLVFAALLLLLDGNQTSERRRLASGAAFLAGFSLTALQFLDVFLHTGHLALFDAAYMLPFYQPQRGLAIEAVFFTMPAPGAYTVRPDGPLGFASLVALRLFRGIFGFEWAVYRGPAHAPPLLVLTRGGLLCAWGLVLLWAAVTVAVARRAGRPLAVLLVTGGAVAFLTAVLGHTELRYYALSRAVWWLTLAAAGAWMLRRIRARAARRPEAT